jgi:hypothetical protein
MFKAVYIHKKIDGALRNAWGKIMRKVCKRRLPTKNAEK